MKKFFVFIVAMLSVITSSTAQTKFIPDPEWKPHVVPTIYGGYNFLQDAPVVGVAVPIYVNFIRGEVDFGYTYLDSYFGRKDIKTLSCSLGLQYGNRVRGYAMVGWINWAHIVKEGAPLNNCGYDLLFTDLAHVRLKGGLDVTLVKNLILNAELGWIIHKKNDAYNQYFDSLSLRVGLGWNF